MKQLKYIICLLVLGSLILSQPVSAKLAVTYEQTIIMIDRIQDSNKIFSADGDVYEFDSSEILGKAQKLKNQQVRVLYVDMFGRKNITDMKLATEPPFSIPENN
jgi:hypothetical protein